MDDYLSKKEAQLMLHIMQQVNQQEWARPLISRINENDGLTAKNKSFLFEMRVGFALFKYSVTPNYEVSGEGNSTLDFGFVSGNKNWFVELMRLEETQAAKDARQDIDLGNGITLTEQKLSTGGQKPTQSEEGETLKAIQRICGKCFLNEKPHKFRLLDDGYNVLIVDIRTFLQSMGDENDILHIGLGGNAVPGCCRRYWKGKLISGAFDKHTKVKGAKELQERVHFIGFTKEEAYTEDELGNITQFIANPHLFSDRKHALEALKDWPIKPVNLL